jgi:class 3 adenylate cyclase
MGLINDTDLRGVIDHFVRLLDFPPGDLQRCANDVDGHLVPRLRAIDMPVAIFIDSVDEYFNKHVEMVGSASAGGELSSNVWYFSQIGLVEVGYQLRRINHHLKVFAAVRKEAYLRLTKTTVMSQQYRGSAVDIAYLATGLREIFLNNIRREPAARFVLPERLAADPLEAFLGTKQVVHSYTGEREDAFDYICRHTLLRPRDFMTIGQRLSALSVDERKQESRLKAVVNHAATEIAHEYMKEIAPYLGDLDLKDLLSRIPSHILTRDQVESIFCEYNDAAGTLPDAEHHVFCALYKAGLLGYLQTDMVGGVRVQKFLRPGEMTFAADGILPKSSHYLVHPVLSEIIARLRPSYAEQIDRVNIVGAGRPWRDPDQPKIETICVLQADVRGMMGLMEQGLDEAVRHSVADVVARVAESARSQEVSEGDHVLITHEEPAALARMARRILDEVYDAPGHPLLRIALHHGEVRLQSSTSGPATVMGGHAVALAARVEPFVTPGEIWCTAEFRDELAAKPSLVRTTPLTPPAHLAGKGEHDGSFNVRKGGSDANDLWVRLYRVEF